MKPIASTETFPAAASCTYLDSASISLMHRGAGSAAVDWQARLANEGSVSFNEQDEQDVFINLHDSGARLFNGDPEDIAIGPSETVLMSSLAWGLAPGSGKSIVATRITHPSTVYPWVRVAQHTGAEMRWISADDQYVSPGDIMESIDDSTAVVCLSHVEWAGGQKYPLADIAQVAHAHGAHLIVDVTQSAGQVPIDVKAMGVDAAVCSTYKWLCGPFGAAIMYVSPALQTINPGIVGWRSHVDMWDFQADRLEYPRSASRFEFSTMSYGAAIAAAKSINFLLEVSIDKIADHNKKISSLLRNGLAERGIQDLSPRNPDEQSAIVAARFAGDNPKFAASLNANKVVVSPRKDFVRFSPHLFNGGEDIARALEVIDRLSKG